MRKDFEQEGAERNCQAEIAHMPREMADDDLQRQP
jgi:hypothetical protein